jgi:hypothetical protein
MNNSGKVWYKFHQAYTYFSYIYDLDYHLLFIIGATAHYDEPWPFRYNFQCPYRHLVGLHRRGISRYHGLYLCMTAQHRKKRIYVRASNGIRIQNPRVRAARTHAFSREGAVFGA